MTDGTDLLTPRPFRVATVTQELKDTVTLHVEPGDGAGAIACGPGQFNMLYAFGAGEAPISLSGVDDDGRLMHTIRAVGGVTRRLVALREGEPLGVRGPFGRGWDLAGCEGADVVIVAGGLGLAPLRPVITTLLEHRARFGRVVILYGTRLPETILYRSNLERWRGRFDVNVDVTVDLATRGWYGDVGFVTRLIERASFDADETVAFVCGPEIMMRLAARQLIDEGVDSTRIFLSLERNMKCAVGLCGHCQFGAEFVCKDGPTFSLSRVWPLMEVAEL